MKNITVIIFFAICGMVISSCSKEDNDKRANIKVNLHDFPTGYKKDVNVYMYKDHKVTSETKMADALMTATTNNNGVANFDLNLTQLNIEPHSILSFAIFYKACEKDAFSETMGVSIKAREQITLEFYPPVLPGCQ